MPRYRLAVLGDPVAHSRSPEIHAAMLDLAGLAGTYARIQADAETLATAIDGLRTGEWDGLNVTMPLKGVAAELADDLSPLAARSHSVNTLVRSDGRVRGHSTDAATFADLVVEERFENVSSLLILGAGGSAAAALASLDDRHQVYVGARRSASAERLTRELGGHTISWGSAVTGALVINTTPLGMNGEALPGSILSAASGLIDLPYASNATPAIVESMNLGLPHVDGHEFLVRQAMASFHLWTGVSVGYDAVASRLKKA